MTRSHSRPSYRNPNGDPTRWLLAAVVYRAIQDCAPEVNIKPQDRASARWFLSGEEGLAWLRAFGIPNHKAQAFVNAVNGGGTVDQQKVILDWIIATRDTVYTLQTWLRLLENWRHLGQVEPNDFEEARQQLKEANLEQWASHAGGHGLRPLAEAVRSNGSLLDEVCPE